MEVNFNQNGFLESPVIIRHFKGGYYVFLGVADDEKTGEKMAIYQSLNNQKLYIRPYKELFDDVSEREDNPAKQALRFEDCGKVKTHIENLMQAFMGKLGI